MSDSFERWLAAFTRRQTISGMAAGVAALTAVPRLAAAQAGTDPRARGVANQTLWYQQPARDWNEALPVGNGRIGAMVFGGIAAERLQLNEGTLWAGGPYDPVNPKARDALGRVRELVFAGRIEEAEALTNEALIARPPTQMPYQTLGDVTLSFPSIGQVADYRRELDLDRAVASTRFLVDGVRHERQVLASQPDGVIAVRLSAEGGALDVDFGLASPHDGYRVEQDGACGLLMKGSNRAWQGVPAALRFAARLAARHEGGTCERLDNGQLRVRGASELTLLIAMATSFRRFDDVSGDPVSLTHQTIAALGDRPFDTIAADAARAHRKQFRRVALDLGTSAAAMLPTDQRIARSHQLDDPALAGLYFDYGRYLLISCSQPGGQPATLQGLWNAYLDPPWGSKYTININTQMNYWPAHSANLAECLEPLVDMLRDAAVTGARTAREMYGARGWVIHHNIDLWRATAPIDGASWGMWPTGGAWLCTHLWEHYDYTRDRAFLASVYPLMAGAARFFLDTLQEDPRTGFLVTNPSISPENQHGHGGALCAGPTMDMAILRDLFDQTGQAARILDEDAELAAEMATARKRLAPYKIGSRGELQEWQDDWDADAPEQNHRHVSHLYGLHPSHQITPEGTPELARAAARSLELRGDYATGWAIAWRINLWARLGDGDRAHSILKALLGPDRTYPNMFDAHPPFQIDGNFGGTAAIAEMLVQSAPGVLHLLPALPPQWQNGSVSGLRIRGACGIEIAWRNGRLESAMLHPDRDQNLTVRYGNRAISVDLRAGQPRRLARTDFAQGQVPG